MTVRDIGTSRDTTAADRARRADPTSSAEPPARPALARSPRALPVIGGMAAALLAVGAAFSFGVPGSAWPVLASLVTQALFVAAGLTAWWLRPHNRIGLLMVLTGLSIWLASLVDAP